MENPRLFDILRKLSEDNCRSFKSFGPGNITQVSSGKDGWGRVTVAIDNETAGALMVGNGSIRFMLLVVDQKDYLATEEELKNQPDNPQQ